MVKSKVSASTSKRKAKIVEDLVKTMEESRSIMIASVKNLPAANFQEIRKKIRGKAEIKIYKKTIILKAIDKIEKGAIKQMKDFVIEDTALLFSKIDAFELSAILAESRTSAKAKTGQEAPEDIIIRAGPTDLVPGPAISQLGAVGLKIAVEDGKIAIKDDKVIVKKGEKIKEAAADIMAKLDIKPFRIGFEPMVAYDFKEDKFFSDVKVDKDKEIENLKNSAGRAIAFALKIGWMCKETLVLILAKAKAEESKIEEIMSKQNIQEAK